MEIQLSDEERAFVERQVCDGRSDNASDYIAALIRADAQRQLSALVDGGNASAHRELTDDVWEEIRHAAAARLPSK